MVPVWFRFWFQSKFFMFNLGSSGSSNTCCARVREHPIHTREMYTKTTGTYWNPEPKPREETPAYLFLSELPGARRERPMRATPPGAATGTG
jgi:hypothetical protein